jgi:hypothetical protein
MSNYNEKVMELLKGRVAPSFAGIRDAIKTGFQVQQVRATDWN